ncbi:porin [Crenobacter cavernae]|uniref:Porin n=2 Tax=Crenobacter cavernae TaxID=2290923 RepID=A0ABY0FIM4_9NEIS|nr:porin [Crenobacter cavernae]
MKHTRTTENRVMNKKLIALAIATLPAVAMADVTIYGRLVGGVERDSIKLNNDGALRNADFSETAAPNKKITQTNVEDYLSWIGFKGQEDLGNGLKAIWQVENYIAIDGTGTTAHSQGTFASRDSFVGLAGNFGKVRLGKLTNAQRDMFDLDVWNNSNGANALDIFKRVAYRPNNSIRYDSPDFAGFSGSLLWGAGENKNAGAATNPSGKSSDVVNAGLNYRNSGFFAQYGYDKRKNAQSPFGNPEGKHATAHTVEAGYGADGLLVSAGFQRTKGYEWSDRAYFNETGGFATGAADNLRTREVALTAAYSIGAWTPKVSLAKGFDQKDVDGKVNDSGYKQYILGVDYSLSKRTKLSAAYGHLSFGENADYAAASGNGPSIDNLLNVKKQSTTSLSVEHWF